MSRHTNLLKSDPNVVSRSNHFSCFLRNLASLQSNSNQESIKDVHQPDKYQLTRQKRLMSPSQHRWTSTDSELTLGDTSSSSSPSINYRMTNWSDPLRKWQYTALGEKLKKYENYGRNRGIVFKFMSYNVLSQDLLEKNPYLYKEHSTNHLPWAHRWKYLRAEIKHYNADIICLQEVQETHLEDYIKFFSKHEYNVIYKKRTGDEYPDGCAIFYKTNVFTLIEHETVEYFQSSTSTLVNRKNVGIIARFAPRRNLNHSFIVATTHLLYNPRREDVRLAQMQMLLAELDRIAFEAKTKKYLPVILCGDFNSPPFLGINMFLKHKHVEYTTYMAPGKPWIPSTIGITNNCKHLHLEMARLNNADTELSRTEEKRLIYLRHSERETITRNEEYKMVLFDSGSLIHNFDFLPVYGTETGVTTHQDEWITVDYIFFSKTEDANSDALKYLRRCNLPSKEALLEHDIKGIPNNYLGSDHFSLIAEFKFEF